VTPENVADGQGQSWGKASATISAIVLTSLRHPLRSLDMFQYVQLSEVDTCGTPGGELGQSNDGSVG